jgi:3-oxoacyl-[acyl-carrier protein] reductase
MMPTLEGGSGDVMELGLEGRVAVVTGASAGIGRAVAQVLAREGVRLAVVARRKDRLDELAEELASHGLRHPLIVVEDVTAPGSHVRLRDVVLDEFKRVDILVNNAGGSRPLALDAPEEEWEEAMTLNFTSVRRITHSLVPIMIEQRWGRIINITGSSEPKGLNAANAAKAAVHAWAKGLSRELGPFGITVNSVAPGRILTEQVVDRLHPSPEDRERFARAFIPLGYFGQPEDVAWVVAFLASTRAQYITGEVIHVDGGLRHFAF